MPEQTICRHRFTVIEVVIVFVLTGVGTLNLSQPGECSPADDALKFLARGTEKAKIHDTKGAIEEFNKAIRSSPHSPEPYEKRGWEYYFLKEYDKAEADFRQSLKLDKSGRRGRAGLAMTIGVQERNREAELEADRGIASFKTVNNPTEDQRKDLSILYTVKGNSQRDSKNYTQAEQSLLKARNLNPRSGLPLTNLGILYTETAESEKAIDAYTRAIDLGRLKNHGTATLTLPRGTNYLLVGKAKEAVDDFTLTIKQDPRLEQAWFLRAAAFESLGDLKAAKADLDHLLTIAPDKPKYQKAWKKLTGKIGKDRESK